MTTRWPARSLARLAVLGAGLALGGCDLPWISPYTPGGAQASYDCFTFEATPELPWTISVTDLTTNETIWTSDVPIGRKLVVRFYEDENPANAARPAVMRWKIMDFSQTSGTLNNAVAVPPAYARRVEQYLRTEGQTRPEPMAAPAQAPAVTTPPPLPPPPPPPARTPRTEPAPNK
jgi:hypothetical protein